MTRLKTENREGWLSPDYHTSRQVKIDPRTAEANRCECLFADRDAVEYYKVLRTQIQQRAAANRWKTIMITSPNPGEGKTLTAVNLALTFAREYSQTVLLVDADLRNQKVHEYLGYTHSCGLADYLEGNMSLSDIIAWPGVEKLTVISGGETIHGSTEMLMSPRMRSLISEMKLRYEDRYIFFDVPPVLNRADSISFAELVDGIILVLEEGKTVLDDLQKAMDLLPMEKIMGVVLNRHRFEKKAAGTRPEDSFIEGIWKRWRLRA